MALTVFFFLLELSFFIQCNSVYLNDFQYVSHELTIPWRIIPSILFFIFAQLFLHVIYCLLTALGTRILSRFFRLSSLSTLKFGIGLWLWGIVFILLANCYFFPNSKFSQLLFFCLPEFLVKNLFTFFLITYLCIVGFVTVVGISRVFCANMGRSILLISTFAILLLAKSFFTPVRPLSIAATMDRPNVIIIGLDSLRPDFLGYFGAAQSQTPFIDHFFSQSTVFSEALTPLARTFPSWVSILTGQYPKQNHIRSNLVELQNLDLTDALPTLLHQAGYETIFATDETRFSNIDKKFNFDKVIVPPIGLNDFLLGTFNDFPLSNLIVNTPLGKWLFPYSYGNRAANVNYQPNSFLNLVSKGLPQSFDKPLFMAIHFCLPHYPYVWSNYSLHGSTGVQRYQAAIHEVDKQAQNFLSLLSQRHLLEHAIVILLSDHGEALALPGDRITEEDLYLAGVKNPQRIIPEFYPSMLDEIAVNRSAGHGTDVLGLSQYHTLLAFQLYGLSPHQVKLVPGVVSLLDIKPTVLNLLHIPYKTAAGFSRVDVLLGKNNLVSTQHFFIESDYSPEAIRTVYPDTNKVLLEGAKYFRIDPLSTRLFVKKEMVAMILGSKQYADIYGEWMLALYPRVGRMYQPILINLNTGKWTDDLTTPFAQTSPVLSMFHAMKAFYPEEIGQSLVEMPKTLATKS